MGAGKQFTSSLRRYARRMTADRVHTMRRGLARGLRRRGGLTFIPERRPTPEHRFISGLDYRDLVVYDVGGYEGLYTLFLSRAVRPHGRVVTFEPNPASHSRLLENLRLNQVDNVQVLR